MRTKSAKHEETGKSNKEQVTIEVFEDRKVAHVPGLGDVTQWNADTTEEPRISIAEFSERVDRDARSLRQIARRIKSDRFQPFLLYSSTTTGKKGIEELWLNEGEALYLCTKLRGEIPEKITWDMIETYKLARRGLLPQQHGMDAGLVVELRKALVEYRDEIRALRAENAQIRSLLASNTSPHGLLGSDKSHEVLSRIQWLVNLEIDKPSNKAEWNSKRRKYEISVRKAAGWTQNGRLSEQLVNDDQEGRAWIRLREIEKEIRERSQSVRERKEPESQPGLPIDLSFRRKQRLNKAK